jgi:hypothetical protein
MAVSAMARRAPLRVWWCWHYYDPGRMLHLMHPLESGDRAESIQSASRWVTLLLRAVRRQKVPASDQVRPKQIGSGQMTTRWPFASAICRNLWNAITSFEGGGVTVTFAP